jgi:hypothetical protein
MINEYISLQGQFKFDVYHKDGTLDYTTDYINNFITPTGLSYPDSFGFADCFRYVSLGSGTGANFVTGIGTTGLSIPIRQSGIEYVGGNGLSSCSNAIKNNYISNACGYRTTNSGITLFRAWRIPDGSSYFTTPFNFSEYILSPGRPRVFAYVNTSTGVVNTGLCNCNQAGNLSSGLTGATVNGLESLDFANAYPKICDAEKAFTRILKNVSVSGDQYLIVNYSLLVSFDSGVKFFNSTPTRISPLGSPYNWLSVSGISSIVHPGIKLINDGNVSSVSAITQIDSSYQFRAGESFIPPLGIPLEPSCSRTNRFGYISDDCLQFLVNDVSGGAMPTGSYKPYNTGSFRQFPSGTMAFHLNWVTETSNSASSLGGTIPTYLVRPRSEGNGTSAVYPDPNIYTQATNAAGAGFSNFSPTTLFTVNNGISDAFDTSLPFTGRQRAKILSYQFLDPSITTGLPVRALVMGYRPVGVSSYWPNVDTLFAPYNSPITPNVFTGLGELFYDAPLYLLSGDIFPGPVVTGYSFMDGNNILQFQFKINWSSPCPSGVIGC